MSSSAYSVCIHDFDRDDDVAGGEGGALIRCLSSSFSPSTTYPFRDGASFLPLLEPLATCMWALIKRVSTLNTALLCVSHRLPGSPFFCGHRLSPGIANVTCCRFCLLLLCTVRVFAIFHPLLSVSLSAMMYWGLPGRLVAGLLKEPKQPYL